MKYPIISPYPLFGSDNYAYLHTVIRYNAAKNGYDNKIYSLRYPDYIPTGPIGPQSKVSEQGSWKKYTQFITDPANEMLAFQIKIPVRVQDKAIICAELYPWNDGTGIEYREPVAWCYDEFVNSPESEIFGKTYLINGQEVAAEYFFAKAWITNIYDPTNKFHLACYMDIGKKIVQGDAPDVSQSANYFQNIIKPETGDKKVFVLRVNLTTLDNNNNIMDMREDTIILNVLSGDDAV